MHPTRKQFVRSLEVHLGQQSTETLEDIASYQKLTWRSICVESVTVSPNVSPRKTATRRAVDVQCKRTLDVVSTATLSDLRVVLSIMVGGNAHPRSIPSTAGGMSATSPTHKPTNGDVDFAFCRNNDITHIIPVLDEQSITVQDIVQQGNVVYVLYMSTKKPKSPLIKPRRLHSAASSASGLDEPPTFAITNTFSGYSLNADIFLRGDGLSMSLKDIVDTRTSVAAVELNAVHVSLNAQELGEIVGFSDDTLLIMMSNSKNQRTILQKLLAKMTLHVDEATKLVHVTFPSDAVTAPSPLIAIQKVPSMRKSVVPSVTLPPSSLKKQSTPPQLDPIEERPPTAVSTRHVHAPFIASSTKPELEHSSTKLLKQADNVALEQPEGSTSAAPSSPTVAPPLTSDFDKAFLAVLDFFTASAPATYSLVAYDELVLSFGVEASGCVSKMSKYLLHARDALKKVLLHCIIQHANNNNKHHTSHSTTGRRSLGASPTVGREDADDMATLLRYLWRGLGHCVWREVRDEIFARCRLDPMTRLGVLQSKLGNPEAFSGFKDEPDRAYADEVTVAVHCVLLCLEPHDVISIDATSVWKLVQILGLVEFKTFRKTLKRIESFCRNRVLPPHVRRRLMTWMALPAFVSVVDRKDESLYGVSLLRKLVAIVVDATDLDLVQPSRLAECLNLVSATKVSTTVHGITGDLVKICHKWVELHYHHHPPTTTSILVPEFQTMVKNMDEIRCAHIEGTCTLVANQDTAAMPMAFRWYLPPIATTSQDRYFFVGEHDAALEFTFVYTSTSAPVQVQFNTMGEPTLALDVLDRLLLCALSTWYSVTSRPNEAASHGDIAVGFGINFCLFSALDSLGNGWYLEDVLKAASIDKIGLGSGVSEDGTRAVLVLRLYGVAWRKATHIVMKEPIHFLLWLKYMAEDELHHAVRLGAMCICELLLSKDTCKSILPLVTMKTATSLTLPLGLAADVYEMLVLSWQVPPQLWMDKAISLSSQPPLPPLSWHFPYILGLISQGKMYAHFTVKILECLYSLLASQSHAHYMAGLMSQPTIHNTTNDNDGDMVELLAKMTLDVHQPVRVLDLAQRILLECLLHPLLGTPLRIARLFPRISDNQLGFRRSSKPAPHGDMSISPVKCVHLLSLDILGKLAIAVDTLMANSPAWSSDLDTLQLRFLCVLATTGGGMWLSKNVAVVSLVVACIHNSKSSPLVCLLGGRVLQTLSCVLSSDQDPRSVPTDAQTQRQLIHSIGSCVHFHNDKVGNAVAICAISAIANLFPVAPWGHWCFEALQSLFQCASTPSWSSYLHCMVPSAPLDRICHLLSEQHQAVQKCYCKGAMDGSARRRIVRKTACTFTASILQLVVQPPTSLSHVEYIRKAKAKKIQQSLLKWMYVKRKTRGFLPAAIQYLKCPWCCPVSSCLATLLVMACGFQVDANTRKPSKLSGVTPAFQLSLFQFLNQLWYHRELVVHASNDLKIPFTYLVFSSHSDADIRFEALKSLSLVTWHYPPVIHFISPAIVKALWGASYFGAVGGTWIEDVLHKSLDSYRKCIGQHLPEIQNALNFFALSNELDEALCVAFILVQNVLLNIPVGDYFKFNVPVNDFVAVLAFKNVRVKAGLCGVLWAMALREDGRSSICSSSDCTSLLLALTMSVFNSFTGTSDTSSSVDLHMLLYNGLGALACMALDPKLLRELMQAKANEPACALAAWIKTKRSQHHNHRHHPTTASVDMDCSYFGGMESLLTTPDMPSHVRTRMKQLKVMHEYGVGPELGFRAVAISSLDDKFHSTRLLATLLLVVETKLTSEWQMLLASFAFVSNTTLSMFLCAVLPTLLRLDKGRASVIPPNVIQSLCAIITREKATAALQSHAIHALGHLSVLSSAAKKEIEGLELCKNISKLPPAVQSEVVHMIALSTKNPASGPTIIHESQVYDVVGAVIQRRDRVKELNASLETAVVKYFRRPVELVQLYSAVNIAPSTVNFPLTILQLLGEVLHEMPHLQQRMLKDAQELTLELSQTLRKWTCHPLIDDITAILVAVLSNQPTHTDFNHVISNLLHEERGVVHMLLHFLSNCDTLKRSTTIQALTLLQQLFTASESALSFLQTFSSNEKTCGFLSVLHVLMNWPDHHHSDFSTLAFGVLHSMLKSTENRKLLLAKLVPDNPMHPDRSTDAAFTKYMLEVWSYISLKDKATRVTDRPKLMGLCLLASQVLCDLCYEVRRSCPNESSSFVSILFGGESIYVSHSTLSHIVQTAALAHLAGNENIRHSKDMMHFVDAATSRSITNESHVGIQFNLLHIYNAVLCVPALFRQIVYRQNVFTTANVDKPMLSLLGQYIAHPHSFELRWVAAEFAGKFCVEATLAIEKAFLAQSAGTSLSLVFIVVED
ncbi:hypothetical protein DYB25_000288 [Aphanomyces astaci]|uniref:Uncharacterized protein n=2 Tax=Aphanomyces astaci TaxID=112090 RepID=A0A397BDK7_APHAT|nr:hypothetical protein DYB25_000288 [Aphanomyces astaci]